MSCTFQPAFYKKYLVGKDSTYKNLVCSGFIPTILACQIIFFNLSNDCQLSCIQ